MMRERAERNIDFNPASAYQTVQVFDGGDPDVALEWKTYSAEECKRQEQHGHESLREKYGKE